LIKKSLTSVVYLGALLALALPTIAGAQSQTPSSQLPPIAAAHPQTISVPLISATEKQQDYGSPAMLGVGEVIIHYPELRDVRIAEACGISREATLDLYRKNFGNSRVPAIMVMEAKPPKLDLFRLHYRTDIATYQDQMNHCLSFISITAEDRFQVRVPPFLNVARNAVVTFWSQKSSVQGPQNQHGNAVLGTLLKMTKMFIEQYKLDQPTMMIAKPTAPAPSSPNEIPPELLNPTTKPTAPTAPTAPLQPSAPLAPPASLSP
jgi:hypothetical protein